MKLNLYSVSDKYIKYLRQFDDKIYDNIGYIKNTVDFKLLEEKLKEWNNINN